jgi:subtilisin-like proprotein convertase family protein
MKGFYVKQSDRLIPAGGTSGLMIEDSLYIDLDQNMTDVNFFIATNHTFSNDLEIDLVSPQDYEAFVCFDAGQLGANDNIITIFDDEADSALVSGAYTNFGPVIKGQVDLNSIFSANSSKGYWKLRINDDNSGNTGRLYAWGVQINNMSSKTSTLSTNCLIQGMYDPATNNMIRDTMRIYLRNAASPYSVKDSDKVYVGILGGATGEFNNTDTGKYYLQFKHRNALETWSAVTIGFDAFTQQYTYEFKADISNAYGSNMVQVDNAPVRFAFYSGDVNQDETIDASDLSLIDNDAINFAGGYIPTDLTGDSFVDATDFSIADNNAYNFVSIIRP